MALSTIKTASIANDAVTTDKIVNDGNLGNKNLIINGAMQVAQRGTSATTYSNSGGFGAADRISFRRGGTWTTTTFDLSQEDTSGLDEFPKCSQIKVQDAVANPNANDGTFCSFLYALEGNQIQHLQYGTSNAKDVTLSFYIKSPVAGTYCVHFEISHASADYVAEYTINSANTWEYKTITVPAPSTSELGTKPTNDNSSQLAIYWILSGNTTGTSTARGSAGWSGTTPDRTRYTVNQANAFSTLNNAVQITGAQLEVGDVATPFEHESYGDTLLKCQRYFEICSWVPRTDNLLACVDYKVEKRAQSTIAVVSSDSAGFSVSVNELRDSRQGFYQSANASHTTRVTMSSDAEL